MLKQFITWSNKSGRFQRMLRYVLFTAFVGLVLVPLLNVVPAILLFGLVFLAISVWLWRDMEMKIEGLGGLARKAFVAGTLSATVTLLTYSFTLTTKGDAGGLWWGLAAVALIFVLAGVGKLFPAVNS